MKLKKYKIVLAFLFFLSVFYNQAIAEESGSSFKTILEEAKQYFSEIEWTESENISPSPLPEPFMLEEVKIGNLSSYGDTNLAESLYPSLDGLGILDYTGIERSVLNFFSNLANQFKEKKIEPAICVSSKAFLPYLINYRLGTLDTILSVYYARPEYKENKRLLTKFRFNIKSGDKIFYILVEVKAVLKDEKLYIEAFDIIGDKNEKASK